MKRLAGFGFNPNSILDIGAYDGLFAAVARSAWPNAFVFMVEAMPEKANQLQRVAKAIGNSDFAIKVLGKHEGQPAEFFVARGEGAEESITTGSSLYPEITGARLERRIVIQSTLDMVAPPDRKFELLKMDIQGAELDVLEGAKRCIKDAELMLLEVSVLQYNEGSPLISDVIAYMKQIGFVVFDILDVTRTVNAHLNQMDILFIRENHGLRYRYR